MFKGALVRRNPYFSAFTFAFAACLLGLGAWKANASPAGLEREEVATGLVCVSDDVSEQRAILKLNAKVSGKECMTNSGEACVFVEVYEDNSGGGWTVRARYARMPVKISQFQIRHEGATYSVCASISK